MLSIPSDQVAVKRQIGTLDGGPAFLVTTKGGLSVVASVSKSGRTSVLGAGSHRAIAIHLAQKKEPRLQVTMLNKNDERPLASFEKYLPHWSAFTVALAARHERDQVG